MMLGPSVEFVVGDLEGGDVVSGGIVVDDGLTLNWLGGLMVGIVCCGLGDG